MEREHLRDWAISIQKNIWERNVFIAMKTEDGTDEKEIDVLKMNNEKDQKLVDFINKYLNENTNI